MNAVKQIAEDISAQNSYQGNACPQSLLNFQWNEAADEGFQRESPSADLKSFPKSFAPTWVR